MSKTRKEKMIEELEESIRQTENELINTPEGMTNKRYRELIDFIKQTQKTLDIVKKM